MTSERDELADRAYRGEVRGEALFRALAEVAAFADHRHELETLALLEAQTAASLRPLVERLSLPAEPQESDRAIGRRMAAAGADYSWRDFLGLFAPTTANAIEQYRRLGELVDESDRAIVDDVVAHEEALQAFADASLRGDPPPSTWSSHGCATRGARRSRTPVESPRPRCSGRPGRGVHPRDRGRRSRRRRRAPGALRAADRDRHRIAACGRVDAGAARARLQGLAARLRQDGRRLHFLAPGAVGRARRVALHVRLLGGVRALGDAPDIGPALADAITCLAEESGKKVVVVAHSMGGLAARFAQGQQVDGRSVADAIRQVITIGTPNRGVILLSIANGEVSNLIVRGATELAGAACDEPPRKQERRDLCELLRAASIPAVKAMDPDSKRLKALPKWSPRLAVDGVAADLRLRVSAFGIGTTVSLGDIVVTVDSATADASPSTSRFVARCSTELTDLIDVVDESHCSHANELSNRRIVRHVVDQVLEAQAANRSRSR
jgi:hypothetical protein